jgi:RNA polymerase sigma-70 factor (ECF subfamily)
MASRFLEPIGQNRPSAGHAAGCSTNLTAGFRLFEVCSQCLQRNPASDLDTGSDSPTFVAVLIALAHRERVRYALSVRLMPDAARSAEAFRESGVASQRIAVLLIAARRGDQDALGQLFDAARHQLLDAASRGLPLALRGRVAPSDVVQETAIDMQRDFARFSGTKPEELFAWLRSILNHNLIDAVRHHGLTEKRGFRCERSLGDSRLGRGALALAGSVGPPDGSAIRKEDAAELHRTLARLPDDYRTAIWLRYWRGLSFAEIAAQMGRSIGATRKLWHRAMLRLNDELAASPSGTHAEPRAAHAAADAEPEDSGETLAAVVS